MSNLVCSEGGELRFTIEVKRATTGEVEVYNLIGKISGSELTQIGEQHGSNAQHSSTECSDRCSDSIDRSIGEP